MIDLIYSNVPIYRAFMNVLYGGGYRKRFADIISLIGDAPRSVCELCFADTIIAEWCRRHDVRWTGFDMNPRFCGRANRLGHAAVAGDVLAVDVPAADVFVMAGSLYHFHDRMDELFDLVWARTTRWIVSEPVRNLSTSGGLLGRLASRSAAPDRGHPSFRFDERTLLEALERQRARHPFSVTSVSTGRDMLLVLESTDTENERPGAL